MKAWAGRILKGLLAGAILGFVAGLLTPSESVRVSQDLVESPERRRAALARRNRSISARLY